MYLFFFDYCLAPTIAIPSAKRDGHGFRGTIVAAAFGRGGRSSLYPVYLWTAFGYGFRYGLRDLGKAVAAAFCGFSFVIATTDYWREELPIALGLLAALIVLPAYAASLIKKLTEAKAQAEAASQAKSQFLASVSHDLRTPLNAIIGISELIGHSPLNRDQMEMIYTIKTSGGSLLSLIDGILDLSRIEAGKVSVDTEAFDLHREIADTITILGPQARQKGLALGANISPRVPPPSKAMCAVFVKFSST